MADSGSAPPPYAARLAGAEGRRLLADHLAATGPGPAIIEVRTRFWNP